jgi:hypothetical protein
MHWSRAGAASLRPNERLTRRRSTVVLNARIVNKTAIAVF